MTSTRSTLQALLVIALLFAAGCLFLVSETGFW